MSLTTLANTRWKINEFPNVIAGNRNQQLYIDFVANGVTFDRMYFAYYSSVNWEVRFTNGSGSVTVFRKGSGNQFLEEYRNIIIIGGTAATWTNLIAWFENNAEFLLPDYYVNGNDMKALADVIRTKGGTSDPLVFPSGFADAIQNITTPIPSNYGRIEYDGSILTVS